MTAAVSPASAPPVPDVQPVERSSGTEAPRVLQVVLSLAPGGTERLVIEITKRLGAHSGAAVCCLDDPGLWATELTDSGVPVHALHRRPGFRPLLGRQIAALSKRHGANVLHCHHYSPFVYGRIAALLQPGLKVLYTEHGRLSDAPPSPKRRLVNPLLGRMSGGIVAVSDDLRRHMIAEGFPPHRVGVIHNGIEPGPRLSPAHRSAARRRLGLPDAAHVVGTVARLDPVKDLGVLIEALASVRKAASQVVLVIVGDGPEREALERRARAAEGTDIRFAGHRADARELLAGFDVFVNSSTHEGVSLTILEAMAASLPVVATRVGGTPEVVVEGVTGVLVPPRAPGQLAQALASLTGDPGRRTAMGDAGRLRVEEHFTLDSMVDRYVGAYRALVEG